MTRPKIILLLLLLLVGVLLISFFLRRNQEPSPSTSPQYSSECGVCGPQGLHNVEGRQCAPGLECVSGTTSASFCIVPGSPLDKCLAVEDELSL